VTGNIEAIFRLLHIQSDVIHRFRLPEADTGIGMNSFPRILVVYSFLHFTMAFVLSQSAGQSKAPDLPKQPAALVSSLYAQVAALHPVGVTKGADMKVFAPYLSKALLHRIDLTAACEADWFRQYPETDMKPGLGWLELGLFSGDQEMTAPSAFHIERAQAEKDGSIRVYVKLTQKGLPSPLGVGALQ
jgi:hypothetical protein